MKETEVIFVFKSESFGFRFAMIETCPSEDVPFAVGISKTVPVLSDKRISESELEIEFSDSLENAIEIVNDVFGLSHCEKDIKNAESLNGGRRLLYHHESAIFLIDYEESVTI